MKVPPPSIETGQGSVRGMTLLELVVVLAILAALAGIATTTTGLAEQGRYEATQRGLAEIEHAILGDPSIRQPDGSYIPHGFVADMGRLPRAVVDESGELSLEELWLQDAAESYDIRTPDGDPQIKLGSGWRGPYLRLPIGAKSVKDGYARPYDLLDEDGGLLAAPADAGEPVSMIRSRGADGEPDAIGGSGTYDPDLLVVLHASAAAAAPPDPTVESPVPARHLKSFSVTVQQSDGSGGAGLLDPATLAANERVVIRIYGPVGDGGEPGTVDQKEITVSTPAMDLPLVFSNIPAGPRHVRAYRLSGAAAAPGLETNLTTEAAPTEYDYPAKASAPLLLYVGDAMPQNVVVTLPE